MTISTTTLKNAARALGYDLWSDPDGSYYLVDYDGVKLRRWDPEHDNNDAMMLAAALLHTIEFVVTEWPDEELGIMRSQVDMPSTRRKILMRAAHIGVAL